MSVDLRAEIVVGYTYDEIYTIYERWKETVDAGDCHFYEWKEDSDLTTVFPYYDAPYEDCLFGTIIHESGDRSYSLFSLDSTKLQEVTKDLTDKFGEAPSVYLSPCVW